MAKCKLFTNRFHVFEDELVRHVVVVTTSESQFEGVTVGMINTQNVTLLPQSLAMSFLEELNQNNFYTGEQWKRFRKYMNQIWDGVDRVRRPVQQVPQKVVLPANMKIN